jgi:dicarboxylate transporter 10
MATTDNTKRLSRWYFGGLASAGAACCTHPLDLLKVHLQTAGASEKKMGLIKSTVNIVRTQGVLAMYSGLSASLLRQLTYSTARFAIYDVSNSVYCSPKKPKGAQRSPSSPNNPKVAQRRPR